jgi:hypothetical protein
MANVWTNRLGKILPCPCYFRPLVCDGLPDASEVIVIGENPATELEANWWSYWDPTQGFHYDKFISDYKMERRASRKSTEISATRSRLARIRGHGIRAIETNIYSNERPDGAGPGISNIAVINTLIADMVGLLAIVAHGNKAQQALKHIQIPTDIAVFETRHFSRIGYSKIDEICEQIAGLR